MRVERGNQATEGSASQVVPLFFTFGSWKEVSPTIIELISGMSALGPAVVISDDDRLVDHKGIEFIRADPGFPFELQSEGTWLSTAERAVLIACGVEGEAATITRRHSVVWIANHISRGRTGPAVALARRASLVVSPESVRDTLGVQSKWMSIDELEPAKFAAALSPLTPAGPDTNLHAVLSAEVFQRHHLALSLSDGFERTFRRQEVRRRLLADNGQQALIGSTPDAPPVALFAQDLIASSDKLAFIADQPECLESGGVRERMAWRAVLDSVAAEPSELDRLFGLGLELDIPAQLAVRPGVESAFSADAVGLLEGGGVGVDVLLERVASGGFGFGALAARLGLERSRLAEGGPVDRGVAVEVVEAVDGLVVHASLWVTGLDLWQRLVGEMWVGDWVGVPPELEDGAQVVSGVAELEGEAKALAASGDLMGAVERFESLRVCCLEADPPAVTTELAARLNLAWVFHEMGEPRSRWEPYVASVLMEVGPPDDLVRLRARAVDLLERVDAQADPAVEWVEGLRSRVEAGVVDVEEALEEIGAHAKHALLWKSGSSFWWRMTGSAWEGEYRPSRPAPVAGRVSGETVAKLDRKARRALAARRWRRAAKLFEQVRFACEEQNPPLRTTEQAARLNLGWALWKRNRPREEWSPLIASVLNETAPSEPAIKLNAELMFRLHAGE